MGNKVAYSPENVNTPCKDIYEVLSHMAIFEPLMSCVCPNIKDLLFSTLSSKKERVNHLSTVINLKAILNYFKDEENLALFTRELEKYYLEHKVELDKTGIDHPQKNTYSIAIAAIRELIQNEKDDTGNNGENTYTSIVKKEKNVVEKLEEIFQRLDSKQNKISSVREIKKEEIRNILGDVYGNLANEGGMSYSRIKLS